MSSFQNLGDLIRRDRDLQKVAVIDLGHEGGPRSFTYVELDAMANGVARALVRRTGRGVPTLDLRVDYHNAAMPGDLTARGKVIKFGGQFSTCEAQVFDAQGKLLASGRGTYYTAPPKG